MTWDNLLDGARNSFGLPTPTPLEVLCALFLSFFLFQGCARLVAGSERINRQVFEAVKTKLERFHPISINPVGGQIEVVLGLAESRLHSD